MKVNLLNINEAFNQKKLTEMLDLFSEGIKDEVLMIQHKERTNAKGVLIHLSYFEELLSYQKAIDEAFEYLIKEEEKDGKSK